MAKPFFIALFKAHPFYENLAHKFFYVYFGGEGIYILHNNKIEKGAPSWEKDISNYLKGRASNFKYTEVALSSLLTTPGEKIREWAWKKMNSLV